MDVTSLRGLLWSSGREKSGGRSCLQLGEEGHLKVRHHPRPGTLEREKHEPWAYQHEDAVERGGSAAKQVEGRSRTGEGSIRRAQRTKCFRKEGIMSLGL